MSISWFLVEKNCVPILKKRAYFDFNLFECKTAFNIR